jgi:hypothetical protein
MKILSYLQCTLNTALVVWMTVEAIRSAKYYALLIIFTLALIVVLEWYLNFRTYKILDKYKK